MISTSNSPERRSLWRNVSFLLMWSSVAASGFADRLIQLAAEPMLGVYEENASAARIQSGILFFFFVPSLVLTIVGGWLSDRLPRKWIMLVCDEGRGVVLLVAFFMTMGMGAAEAIPDGQQWKVYLILACTGMFAAVFNPTRQSTIPDIVDPGHLQQANAVLAGIALIAGMIGLLVGGPVIEHSVATGVLTAALAYLVSGWFFAFLRPTRRIAAPVSRRPSVFRQVVGAVGYLRCHRTTASLVWLNILFWSAAYVFNAAIAALNRGYYGIATEDYLSAKATMVAVLGFGMLCGSVVVMWIRTRRESGVVAMTSLLLASLCLFLLALNRSYGVGLVLAFGAGLFGGIAMICIETLTQSVTPNHIRGRVFGLRALLNTLSGILVNLAIWRLPEDAADRLMIPILCIAAGALALTASYAVAVLLLGGPAATARQNVAWHLCRIYTLIWHRLEWRGRHRLPTTGPVILASNHTTGIDPMLIQASVPRIIQWVMLERHRHRLLEPLWKAIEPIALKDAKDEKGKKGGQGRLAAVRSIIASARDGRVIGLFPEGGLQRDERDLKPFQPGIGLLARRSEAVIVPVWIDGTPRTRHMAWHFLLPSRSRVTFGIPYTPDPALDHQAVADDLRRRMLELAEAARAARDRVS